MCIEIWIIYGLDGLLFKPREMRNQRKDDELLSKGPSAATLRNICTLEHSLLGHHKDRSFLILRKEPLA